MRIDDLRGKNLIGLKLTEKIAHQCGLTCADIAGYYDETLPLGNPYSR